MISFLTYLRLTKFTDISKIRTSQNHEAKYLALFIRTRQNRVASRHLPIFSIPQAKYIKRFNVCLIACTPTQSLLKYCRLLRCIDSAHSKCIYLCGCISYEQRILVDDTNNSHLCAERKRILTESFFRKKCIVAPSSCLTKHECLTRLA